MPDYSPPKINTQWIGYVSLVDQANTKVMKANPTIAAGDFKTSLNGGAFGNLGTLPTVTPASGVAVKITLSTSEMNGENVFVQCIDAAGAEWCDLTFNIQTATRQLADLAYPATSGRSMVVTAAGVVDATMVLAGASGTTNAITTSGGVTLPAATIASTTNITAATGVDVTKILGTAVSTPATAGILDVNVKNMNNVSGASITTIKAVQGLATDGVVPTVTTLTNLPAITANWLTATGIAADAITAAKIADGAIDNATFANDTGVKTIRSGTAQAGAATTITLDASASATDSIYNNDVVYITGGTGAGQARFITAYVGSTKVATVGAWQTNPDATSTFAILPFIANAAAPTTAQIATAVWQDSTGSDFTTASSIGKALYVSNVVPGAAGGHFIAGTNAATSITTGLTSNITGDLSGSVGSVTGAVGSVTGAVGSVTGNVGGNVVGTVGSVVGAVGSVAGNISGNLLGTLSATERDAIATAIMKLDFTGLTGEASRSTLNALRAIRNRWAVSAGTLTVYKEDDATPAWTGAVVTTAGNPVSSIDPV